MATKIQKFQRWKSRKQYANIEDPKMTWTILSHPKTTSA